MSTRDKQLEYLLLQLITKELKDYRIKSDFEAIGFETSQVFNSDLSFIIFNLIGMEHKYDELWEWYQDLLELYCKRIHPQSQKSLQKESSKVLNMLESKVLRYRN